MLKNNLWVILFMPALFFIASCTALKNTGGEVTSKNSTASEDLYLSIAHMDSVLFSAFNSRDVEKLKTLFTDDLEFYHDKDGLTGYSNTMESFIKTAATNSDLKRELIPGSLEVYPLKDFGAMQIGLHRFCHSENGKPDCGAFKFVHIWKKMNEEWKISRVISYGH